MTTEEALAKELRSISLAQEWAGEVREQDSELLFTFGGCVAVACRRLMDGLTPERSELFSVALQTALRAAYSLGARSPEAKT